MDLRNAVKEKLRGSSKDDLVSTINDAKNSEATLPGLGVLFELYYSSLSNEGKDALVNSLAQMLN